MSAETVIVALLVLVLVAGAVAASSVVDRRLKSQSGVAGRSGKKPAARGPR